MAADGGKAPLVPRPFDPTADGATGPAAGLADGMTAEGGDFVDWVGIVKAQSKLMMVREGPNSRSRRR